MRAIFLLLGACVNAQNTLIARGQLGTINGRPCKCVPVHECDARLVIKPASDTSVYNGRDLIDPRFGEENEEGCIDAMERCCALPTEAEVPTTKRTTSRNTTPSISKTRPLTTQTSTLIERGQLGTINGRPCKCVPVHECDARLVIKPPSDTSVYNGRDLIDPRFGEENEEGCIDPMERCCALPAEAEVPTTKRTNSRRTTPSISKIRPVTTSIRPVTTQTSTLIQRGQLGTVNGRPCKCVPVHECDANLVIKPSSRTAVYNGAGLMDERFGEENEEGCIDALERCCALSAEPEVPTTKRTTSRRTTPSITKIRPVTTSIRPVTAKTSTLIQRGQLGTVNGRPCKCVPVHECDANLVIKPASKTAVYNGAGLMDERFGEENEEGCIDALERCCALPTVTSPTVNPTTVTPTTVTPTTVTPSVTVTTAKVVKGCGYRNQGGLDPALTSSGVNEAKFGEFPWVVAVGDSTGEYLGVGALIHPQVVITVAHIVEKSKSGNITIRAGEWNRDSTLESLPHQDRTVQEIYKHQDWKPNPISYDAVLLRLQDPFELTDHINVICLPEAEDDLDTDRSCVVNGWWAGNVGTNTTTRHKYTSILRSAEITFIPRKRCELILRKRFGRRWRLHQTFVCGSGPAGEDTCNAEGGAPLVCPHSSGRFALAGLSSWGVGCARRLPDAYSSVTALRNWLDEKMAAWGYTL